MRIRLCCLLFLTDQERYNIFFNRLGSLALYGLQRQNSYGQTLAEARKKDVFNCSDGSNIYPRSIELLLEQDSLIHQAALLGDRRPFIAALIVPDRGRIAAELNKEESSLTDDDIQRMLWPRVEMINEGLEHYEQIRKMTVLKEDFPERVWSITAFQKVKVDRRELGEIYQREIKEIYEHPVA